MNPKVGQEWEQSGTRMGTKLEQSGNKNPESATWGKLGTRTQKWIKNGEPSGNKDRKVSRTGKKWGKIGNKVGTRMGTKWEQEP